MFSLKSLKFLKTFKFDAGADPYGHKWEVGYRGHGLGALEAKLTGAETAIQAENSPPRLL